MRIQKNTENTITLTLAEKSTLTSPDYLIKLTNDLSKESKVIVLYDVSEYVESYNKFLITESDSEDLQNSIVSLSPVGKWSYSVYEMNVTSPRSNDTSLSVGIVETGICIVEGEDKVRNFFTEEDNETNPVFDA